jgi:plasmid maintenance system antidote protein VapI
MKSQSEHKNELDGFTKQELAEAFVFPLNGPKTASEKYEDTLFWNERRKTFEGRTESQKIHSLLLQLKFQLEEYVESNHYEKELNFGYFLSEYVGRQAKRHKEFAAEIDIKADVLSQYINNHRKPTEQVIIRLELHSNGMIPAIVWLKLLQKDKEHEIMNNKTVRNEEIKHVKNKIELAY